MKVPAETVPESPAPSATRAKTRVLMVLLGLLAVWPLVHHALVLRWDLSPWHYCGFAMYCLPRPRLRIDFEGGGRPLDATIKKRIHPWVAAYADKRQAMGELAEPDTVARAILATAPELASFEIVVTTFYFDVPSASFLKKVRRYPYTR